MKFIPFILSILLIGNIYFLSEIFFFIGIILNLGEFRIKSKEIILSLFFIFIFFAFGSFKGFSSYAILIPLVFIPFIKLEINPIYFKYIKIILFTNLLYGCFLYIITLITDASFASNFEFPFYGYRSSSGYGITEYVVGDFALPRFYGFSSEPSTYALFSILSITILSVKGVGSAISKTEIFLVLFTILISQSLSGILLSLIYLFYFRKNVFTNSGLSKIIFVVSVLFISFIYIPSEIVNALKFRYFLRVFEILNGEDGSAFIRLTAGLGSIPEFLKTASISQILLGMNKSEVQIFLDSIYFIKYDSVGARTLFTGTKGSFISLFFLNFGLIGSICFLIIFLKLKKKIFKFIFLFFLIFSTYLFSYGSLSFFLILLNGVKYNNSNL